MHDQQARARVLFAEDNEDHAFLIRRSLQQLGVELVHASDGEDALDKLGAWKGDLPDLVLLDINMPRLGGLEVLERMRGDERLRHVPVVILSTSQLPADRKRAYAGQANSYVAKPSSFTDFRDVLHQLGTYWTEVNAPPRTA